MQLQGIVLIQLQGNVNCQGNKLIQRTHIYSQKVKSFEAIIFVYGIIFISRNLSVHSLKLYSFRKTYSFRETVSI